MTDKTRAVLSLSRPGFDEAAAELHQIQVAISAIDPDGTGSGYRLAGPKISGMQVPLAQVELDERAATEIRRVLDATFPQTDPPATRELLHALQLAVVTIRAAWVEARHIGPEEGIEVLEDIVLATAADMPDLDQYDGALAVFDAEYGTADRTADAKRLRVRLAAKEA